MSKDVSDKLAQLKLNRFISYLVSLDQESLHNVLQHLPDNFEEQEKSCVLPCIKRLFKSIKECCCS